MYDSLRDKANMIISVLKEIPVVKKCDIYGSLATNTHDDLSDIEVSWHWHNDMELFVVTEGCADVTVGNERYILTAGNGCFINSGVIHSMRDRDNSGCRYHSIVFHPSLVGGSAESVYYQAYVMPVMQNTAFPFTIFDIDDAFFSE